jgi:hypothetical protein
MGEKRSYLNLIRVREERLCCTPWSVLVPQTLHTFGLHIFPELQPLAGSFTLAGIYYPRPMCCFGCHGFVPSYVTLTLLIRFFRGPD